MPKVKKEAKAEIIAFYVGGAKLHAVTTSDKHLLDENIETAMDNNEKYVRLDTVNEESHVEDESVTLLFDKMLFYTTFQLNKSGLITAPPISVIHGT